jgi:hypothetical protein
MLSSGQLADLLQRIRELVEQLRGLEEPNHMLLAPIIRGLIGIGLIIGGLVAYIASDHPVVECAGGVMVGLGCVILGILGGPIVATGEVWAPWILKGAVTLCAVGLVVECIDDFNLFPLD